MKKTAIYYDLQKTTEIFADIAVTLFSNGANSTRTARNLKRIAPAYHCDVELYFSHSAIVISLEDLHSKDKFTITKSIPHYHVNYSIISKISILTWKIKNGEIPTENIEQELTEIKTTGSYPEWIKITFVSLATAALAKLFDATYPEFAVCFLACAIGFLARKVFITKKFNIYVCFLVGAFTSTSVVNIFRILGITNFHAALSACVLWLIPGVPLINGFLDIVSGYIINGWAKVAMGFMLIFMIAVGFVISLFIFGYGNTI